jgi:DnaD/phage-associated family protein
MITAFIAEDLKTAATTYPLKWTLDAIHEAAVQNKRSWKYIEAILKRWKAQGNQDPMKKEGANHANRKPNTPAERKPDTGNDAAARSAAERILARRAQQASV